MSYYSCLYLADVENRHREAISLNRSLDQIISYVLNLYKDLNNLFKDTMFKNTMSSFLRHCDLRTKPGFQAPEVEKRHYTYR